MKDFFWDVIKITLTITGSIIGAGFITGKEIVRFFGGSFILPSVYCAFLVFSFFIYILLSSSCKGKAGKIFSVLNFAANAVILSCMLSGLDYLGYELLGIPLKYKIISIISITVSTFIVSSGIRGLEKFNLVIVPLMIVSAIVIITSNAEFYPIETTFDSVSEPYKIFLYAGLNLFLSAPVFADLGKGKDKKIRAVSGLLSGTLLAALILLIILAVTGEGTLSSEMPVLAIFSESKILRGLYGAIVFLGIITTLLASHYCLIRKREKRRSVKQVIIINLGALALSVFGFGNIVDRIYPVLGAVGAVYLVMSAVSQVIFPEARQERTLLPPKRTE